MKAAHYNFTSLTEENIKAFAFGLDAARQKQRGKFGKTAQQCWEKLGLAERALFDKIAKERLFRTRDEMLVYLSSWSGVHVTKIYGLVGMQPDGLPGRRTNSRAARKSGFDDFWDQYGDVITEEGIRIAATAARALIVG